MITSSCKQLIEGNYYMQLSHYSHSSVRVSAIHLIASCLLLFKCWLHLIVSYLLLFVCPLLHRIVSYLPLFVCQCYI